MVVVPFFFFFARDRTDALAARPLLAAPDATLWLCTGMGARGMAWAGVCAELLASRITGEPWPLARDLARHVDSQRRRAFIRDKA